MRDYARLSDIYRMRGHEVLYEELFNELIKVYPEGIRDDEMNRFGGLIPADKPALDEIFRILKKHGFTEVPHRTRALSVRKTYHAEKVRHLDDDD